MNVGWLLIPLGLLFVVGMLLLAPSFRRRRSDDAALYDSVATGICTVRDGRVIGWNTAMAEQTDVEPGRALGARVDELPEPWCGVLAEVLAAPGGERRRQLITPAAGESPRRLTLYGGATAEGKAQLVLLEPATDDSVAVDELLHGERLAAIGRLAAGVAHEIGNPVTGIACIAQNLRDDARADEDAVAAEEILKQTERVSRTLNALMQLSHPGSASHVASCSPCNVADCIDEATHLLSLDTDAAACSFDNRCDRELLVSADAQLLLQVFINLLDNARSAGAPGPVVVEAVDADVELRLYIDNPGATVSDAVLKQVFEPFFTTKDVGKGTGLGLPLVRSMLTDMGGAIELLSPSPRYGEGGTRAELRLLKASYGESYTTTSDTPMVS
ncbi:MAG: HAMP domain-containing sensor histidine kinase [Pseudomonadota bacterium]